MPVNKFVSNCLLIQMCCTLKEKVSSYRNCKYLHTNLLLHFSWNGSTRPFLTLIDVFCWSPIGLKYLFSYRKRYFLLLLLLLFNGEKGAAEAMRRNILLIYSQGYHRMGLALAKQRNFRDAASNYQRALELTLPGCLKCIKHMQCYHLNTFPNLLHYSFWSILNMYNSIMWPSTCFIQVHNLIFTFQITFY